MSQGTAALAHDPIYGIIEGRGELESKDVARVFGFPPLMRLSAIKQIPFASQRFLGAEHTRYSHALGTYRTCGELIDRLISRKFTKIPAEELRVRFESAFTGCDAAQAEQVVIKHTLAAALLQDIGELPYGQVTEQIYYPRDDVIQMVSDRTGMDTTIWTSKDLFSVACVWDDRHAKYLEPFDRGLLSYLIAPGYTRLSSSETSLLAWTNILNGQLDADRLDYVYRDAYHTIGNRGTPDHVIKALIRYDEDGPVLENTGAVTDFLTIRANLWRSVYLDGRTRFGQILLRQVLNFVQGNEDLRKYAADNGLKTGLSVTDFQELDDHCLWRFLTLLRKVKLNDLNQRTKHALEILFSHYRNYLQEWVPAKDIPAAPRSGLRLPDDVFYDAFDEIYDHTLYRANGIFVQQRRLDNTSVSTPLEKCVPHYGELLSRSWKTHPMRNHIQIHLPHTPSSSADWKHFEKLIKEGDLFDAIHADKSQLTTAIPSDTQNRADFKPPVLGISFSFLNETIIRRLVRILFYKKQRYITLLGPWSGFMTGTRENSQSVVDESDAVLCVLSKEYMDKYLHDHGGNISAEVHKMIERIKARKKGVKEHMNFKVVCVSLDGISDLMNFPWEELDLDGNKFVGPELRQSGMDGLREAVDVVLDSLSRK